MGCEVFMPNLVMWATFLPFKGYLYQDGTA